MRILSSPQVGSEIPAVRRWIRDAATVLPGLMLCAAISALSFFLCRTRTLQELGISTLVVAMTIGIIGGNTVFDRIAPACLPGLAFARQKLLRLGIILYGMRLTFQDIAEVGASGVLIDALMVVSTFGLALLLGMKLLKLERDTVILVGAGSAICGAAAVLATAPVLKARADDATVAVATVVIFGTMAMFLYPMLYRVHADWALLPDSAEAFGVYAGSTIHEVAQVIAAARAADASTVDTAVISKMVRVMLLCPFLATLAICVASAGNRISIQHRQANAGSLLQAMPWFAVLFIAVIALNSFVSIPAAIVRSAEQTDTVLLAMAMSALGLSTRLSAFRQAGMRPLLLAAALFAWLIVGGAAINQFVPKVLGYSTEEFHTVSTLFRGREYVIL